MLQPATGRRGATADLIPVVSGATPEAARALAQVETSTGATQPLPISSTTQVVYEAVASVGVAWLTPSLLGDAVTHPTSPYDGLEVGAPPPPPLGLVQWYKTPDPKRLAQLTVMLLSVGFMALVTGSARLAGTHGIAQQRHTPATTIATSQPARVTTLPNQAKPTPTVTTQFTVQKSAGQTSSTAATTSARATHPSGKHRVAQMPLRRQGNPGKAHKAPGSRGHGKHR